jgi:hypothetical protein
MLRGRVLGAGPAGKTQTRRHTKNTDKRKRRRKTTKRNNTTDKNYDESGFSGTENRL